MKFQYNDGGRRRSGFKGTTSDCVVRAIAIISQKPYIEVRKEIGILCTKFNEKQLLNGVNHKSNMRKGIAKPVYHKYILSLGFEWVFCRYKVHLKSKELPMGRIIVSVSKHLCAVVNKVLNDMSDCSNGGRRLVYGYYKKTRN